MKDNGTPDDPAEGFRLLLKNSVSLPQGYQEIVQGILKEMRPLEVQFSHFHEQLVLNQEEINKIKKQLVLFWNEHEKTKIINGSRTTKCTKKLPAEHPGPQAGPPQIGEYLLHLLLPRAMRDPLIGDIIEDYRTRILPQFGPAKARFWFWKEVIFSILSVWKGGLWKIGAFLGIAKVLSRFSDWFQDKIAG